MIKDYIIEFQQISMMMPNISKNMVTFLFMEGLLDPLRSMVKVFTPTYLQDAIKRELTLKPSMMRYRSTIPSKSRTFELLEKSASYLKMSLYHS